MTRLHLLILIFFVLLLGVGLAVAGQHGYWGLLHLVLCVFAAVVILYVSRTRAEYLWLGALGGVALVLTPTNPALTGNGPFWPDVICVGVFVVYYKLIIARHKKPGRNGDGSAIAR